MATKRMLQVGEQVRAQIATMIVRGDVADPRLKSVTINSVTMSPDLQIAKVYYSVYGDDLERQRVKRALESASGRFRKAVGSCLRSRFTPEIVFYYDDTIEHSQKILNIMSEIQSERKNDNNPVAS